jgi:hypothetical protein
MQFLDYINGIQNSRVARFGEFSPVYFGQLFKFFDKKMFDFMLGDDANFSVYL